VNRITGRAGRLTAGAAGAGTGVFVLLCERAGEPAQRRSVNAQMGQRDLMRAFILRKMFNPLTMEFKGRVGQLPIHH